ncbi:MAG: hypothetical protein ACREM3_19825 [Candidatus Rokuibacteriota bacterium]
MGRSLTGLFTLLAVFTLSAASLAWAAPSEDRILPAEQYTSDKARQLGRTHARALRDLNAEVYHCMPWLDVKKDGIGFFKPKHLQGDIRYMSLNVLIDQEPSAQFSRLTPQERHAAMFSRYVGPLLRRMTRSPGLTGDASLDGFTVILSWLKEVPQGGERAVHETIAVFVPKGAAAGYVRGTTSIARLADLAHVLAFDGETPKGAVKVKAWDDNFVATYKVASYEVEKGFTCR